MIILLLEYLFCCNYAILVEEYFLVVEISERKLYLYFFVIYYKFYKNNFEKIQNWEKMQEFLDAAHDFTQKKLLLKKGN